ncbi:MAG: YcxB family protein [Ginsengibacter sp.]
MRIVFIVMSIALLLGIISAIVPSSIAGNFSIFRLAFPSFFVVILPVLLFFTAKKNYASNKRIHEEMEYNFENNFLAIKGESFNSQISWDKIYKVSKTKRWLFIWQTGYVANAIPKSDLSKAALVELKQILTAQVVKNNLR